jgi:alpha-tubulin suppressor-like RCC1 family protein
VPIAITNNLGSNVAAIAAGDFHTCVVTVAGGASCWGGNGGGQLGNNSTTNSNVPVAVQALVPLTVPAVASSGVVIAGGHEHSCALTSAGGVQCWGYNNLGELGNKSMTNSSLPVTVSEP